MKKIIIDTDPGIDDAMALMLAVQSGEFDIQAITTVCGNSTIENTTRNARYILNILKRNDLPIYSGASKPLIRILEEAVVHGTTGLAGINPQNDVNLTKNAVNKILQLIRKNPKKISIVALGPLTNIACAIRKDRKTMMNVKEIVMMGGAIKVPGNMNRVAEFNMYVDPEAAKIVFDLPIKKILVPLDVCNQVRLTEDNFRKITNKDLSSPLMKMIRPYIVSIGKDTGIKAALMYDPLTVFYLLSPESCKANDFNIQIETKGEFTRGMTVADLRNVKDEMKNNCTVVEEISRDHFINYFIRTLSK